MSQYVSHSMSTQQFLVLAGNVVKKSFFDSTRVTAKRVYSDIVKGERVGLLQVGMEDKSTLDCHMSLDCSEYRGSLSFSQFRRHLGLLLSNISARLEAEEEIPVLSDESGKAHVFNLPVLAVDGEQVNALVLGWEMIGPAAVEFKILFLDPEQFRKQEPAEADPGEKAS